MPKSFLACSGVIIGMTRFGPISWIRSVGSTISYQGEAIARFVSPASMTTFWRRRNGPTGGPGRGGAHYGVLNWSYIY